MRKVFLKRWIRAHGTSRVLSAATIYSARPSLISKFLSVSTDLLAHRLQEGKSILLQNSQGNVCNSLACLTQLILDPHARTLNGFIALIHKEWVVYGLGATKQIAIFAHFAHCVFELLIQQPFAFEFTEALRSRYLFLSSH